MPMKQGGSAIRASVDDDPSAAQRNADGAPRVHAEAASLRCNRNAFYYAREQETKRGELGLLSGAASLSLSARRSQICKTSVQLPILGSDVTHLTSNIVVVQSHK
jgi:hypothetical protein